MEKTYTYKWTDSQGETRVLPMPINGFEQYLEINTAGSQLRMDLPLSFIDEEVAELTDLLQDENGDYILLNTGDNIIIEQEYTFGDIPGLNNKIEVVEFSDYNPAGKTMFQGLVTSIEPNMDNNVTTIIALSYGVELDNYLVQVLPETIIEENDFENYDAEETLFARWKSAQNRIIGTGQSFQVDSDTTINKITLYLKENVTFGGIICDLYVIEGTPTNQGSLLGYQRYSVVSSSLNELSFQFPYEISLTGSTDYSFFITNEQFTLNQVDTIDVAYETTGTYADGQKYDFNDSTGWAADTGSDLVFEITTPSGAIGNVFNSYDPSDIARELVDSYRELGGTLSYDSSSIADTNTTVSYTFKFNTYLEGLKKAVELAPAEWYWYANPRDSLIYFDKKRTTTDHTLTKGKEVSSFRLKYSLEQVKNKVYFSGGDTGSGTNLLTLNNDLPSQEKYGSWLEQISDNRVTTEATANTLSQAIINEFSEPQFEADVVVVADEYDISNFMIGENVALAGYNSLIDSLLLQINAIEYKPDYARLKLEVLPPTQTKRIEDIRRNLKLQQTENNPNDT